MKKTIVILGGGVTGLSASYVLAKNGYSTVVLEKNDFLGGLSATFTYKDYLLDYGPHNFHPGNSKIFDFVKEELKVPLNRISISSSRLLFMGKLVDYPLKIVKLFRNMSIKEAVLTFSDYFNNWLAIRLGIKKVADDSFENWTVNRFGRRLYDSYFGPYVKKVWGIAGDEIDVSVAVKKIPEPSLIAFLIWNFTGIKAGKYHSEDPSRIKSYYPPKGIGMISDALRDKIKELGGTIELNSEVKKISVTDKKVTYASGASEKEAAWDYVINTCPLDMLVPRVRESDSSITKSAANLKYRSIIFLYVITSRQKVFDYPWIYFNDRDSKDLIFNRIYEVRNFSPEMVKSKNGIICIEITCYKGDETWGKSDEQLFEKCISYLEKSKFLDKGSVIEYFTKRMDSVYPVFKKGCRADLENVLNFLASKNIFSLGRQGLFNYANIDHCFDMSLKLEDLFKNGSPDKEKYMKVYSQI